MMRALRLLVWAGLSLAFSQDEVGWLHQQYEYAVGEARVALTRWGLRVVRWRRR